MKPYKIVVMGVCGCGKSTLAKRLAEQLNGVFLEGDAFHTPANIAKMSSGTPLTDADRQPWLETLGSEIRQQALSGAVVLACSSLKRSYRDLLRKQAGELFFVYLEGSPDLLNARLSARQGHYMSSSLLQSQLKDLEAPGDDEASVTLSIQESPDHLLECVLEQLSSAKSELK